MNFIIVGYQQQWETLQWFTFHQGRPHDQGMLGSFVGNINDPVFVKKLERIRGRLWLKNVNYSPSVGTIHFKEVKRMNDLERYNRKMSKVFAEFWRQVDKQNGLFREEEINKLSDKYKSTVIVLKERYNQ